VVIAAVTGRGDLHIAHFMYAATYFQQWVVGGNRIGRVERLAVRET
jgi:hypothetical protein